jgi:5-methylcytosine-specific restriction endonuclease McrA
MTNSEFFSRLPENDFDWSDEHWAELLHTIVADGLVSWAQVSSLVLGHFNPPQVGTSIASKISFQRHYERKQTWRNVREWYFNQDGACADCGNRLELQADHVISKEIVGKAGMSVAESMEKNPNKAVLQGLVRKKLDEHLADLDEEIDAPDIVRDAICGDVAEFLAAGEIEENMLASAADRLDNMILRCRRCNVIRRPSHQHGGKTFLTTEAALMWLLLVKRPRTYVLAQSCNVPFVQS